MSEKCERCKRGYSGVPPKDDVEWLDPPGAAGGRGALASGVAGLLSSGSADVPPPALPPGERRLRVARCTRCGAMLADLCTIDRDRAGVETHDVCVVAHELARVALLQRDPAALAAVSTQIRRRHLEEIASGMPTSDRATLERIERGALEATEVFRGLATRALALASDLPPINDVRPRAPRPLRSPAAAVGPRVPLELGDGSRVMLEPSVPGGATAGGIQLTRMRGDAVLWRVELPGTAGVREGHVARVQGRGSGATGPSAAQGAELAVLVGGGAGSAGGDPASAALFLLRASDGALRGPSPTSLRAASFEAHALPEGCTFIATYQSCAVAREDAQVAWKGSAAGFPVAVPMPLGAVVVDAPWRLVALALPEGRERWSIPVDRGAQLAPSGEGHLLLTTSDVVTRIDARGPQPRLAWIASGASALPLAGGGAALVRERWDKTGRTVECVVLDAAGRRRFAVARPEATKAPTAELGPGVLLYHAAGDVAVSVGEQVTYALALPSGSTASVTVDDGGAWVEYEGIVDRIDQAGRRVGRWRVG